MTTLRQRARAGWHLLLTEPDLDPADVLAAIVWPSGGSCADKRCLHCERPVKAYGLCARHYWNKWNHERKVAA